MIKSWRELGEVLAEFENRISTLENSQGSSATGDRLDKLEGGNLPTVEVKHINIHRYIKEQSDVYE